MKDLVKIKSFLLSFFDRKKLIKVDIAEFLHNNGVCVSVWVCVCVGVCLCGCVSEWVCVSGGGGGKKVGGGVMLIVLCYLCPLTNFNAV